MADRDQQSYIVDSFRGLYARTAIRENVPPGYFKVAKEVVFSDKSVRTRKGFINVGTIAKNIVRVQLFRLSNAPTVQRMIVLDDAGNFFDPLVSIVTPILTVVGAVDFSILTMFDRVYISPHNRVRGFDFLYIYEPLLAGPPPARLAGGIKPISTMIAATSATVGTVQAGIHLIAVAYETTSGFITQPNYQQASPYSAPGGFKIDLSSIPTGPLGTAKRHILVSKRIPSYDGNPLNYEIFFIAEIAENVSTTLTIDFVDSQLVDSGDFLNEQLALIDGFVQMCTYQGCVVGVGELDNPSIARISKAGEPESFSAADGFVIVNPGEGGGLKNCTEYRNTLVLFKSFKTYSTISNGGPPNTWPVSEIDSSLGTECFGVGRLFDDPGGVTNDAIVVATRGGVYAFDGSYASRPLSFVIENIWNNRPDFTNFAYTQVFVDPINKLIYISYFDQITLISGDRKILVCDYSDGLNWESVRWSQWGVLLDSVGSGAEVRSIGVVFNTSFLPRFFMVLYDSVNNTGFYRAEAPTDPVIDVIGTIILQPVNPDGKDGYKLYQGGYFVSEGFGEVEVAFGTNQIFDVPDNNLPGCTNAAPGATYSFLKNERTDYLAEDFKLRPDPLDSTVTGISINKLTFLYRQDLEEIVR